jgi:hypothetical protein
MSKKKQQNLSQFVSKKCAKYGANDPKQKEVTDALVHIIDKSVSASLVVPIFMGLRV